MVEAPNPNVITYNAAIHACERRGLWERALDLLESLCLVVQPQSTSLNSAMSACEKGQQWEAALFLLTRFSHLSCERTLVTYGAASAACAVSQSWETGLLLLCDMRQAKVFPSCELMNCLVDVCRRSWAWQQALDLLLLGRAAGLCSAQQRVAVDQALDTSQAQNFRNTWAYASRTATSTLELRHASLSDERFVWRRSRPVAVISDDWLRLATSLAPDCIKHSLEQQNGYGSTWQAKSEETKLEA